MKIFLGVLESDLRVKMGLMDAGISSSVDPRKLAKGEQHETVFIAEVLCWMFVKLNQAGAQSVPTKQHQASPQSRTQKKTGEPMVRYDGYIDMVDHDWEIATAESSLRNSQSIAVYRQVSFTF